MTSKDRRVEDEALHIFMKQAAPMPTRERFMVIDPVTPPQCIGCRRCPAATPDAQFCIDCIDAADREDDQ